MTTIMAMTMTTIMTMTMIMIMIMKMKMKQSCKNFMDSIYNTFVVPLDNWNIVSFVCSRI